MSLAVPTDRSAWRPQAPRPVRVGRAIADPILEPLWEGIHVLAYADGDSVRLIDLDGEDVGHEHGRIVAALRAAITTADSVIDGWLTDQASRTGVGLTLPTVQVPRGGLLAPRTLPAPKPVFHDRPGLFVFVAVDLLVLEGEHLFEIPLLERKRLLESVVEQADLVRVSPFVRPPLEHWLATWQAAGFGGLVLKAANSRYVPGRETDEWRIELPRRRP